MGMATTNRKHLFNSLSSSWLSINKHINWWLSNIVPSARALKKRENTVGKAQLGNYGNLLSQFFIKSSWKWWNQRWYYKKLIKRRFHEISFRWEWFSCFSTLYKVCIWLMEGKLKTQKENLWTTPFPRTMKHCTSVLVRMVINFSWK